MNEEIGNYYKILGIKAEASDKDVYDSCGSIANLYKDHPNLAPKKIQEINEAYEKIMAHRRKQDPVDAVKSDATQNNTQKEHDRWREEKISYDTETKKCPFCAEMIKSDAIKCRYCGERLDTKPTIDHSDDHGRNQDKLRGQDNSLPHEAAKVESPPESSPQQSKISKPPIEIPKEKVITYAGFWKRFAAFFIDFIITTSGCIVVVIWLVIMFRGGTIDTAAWERIGSFCGFIVGWLYYALMESSSKQGTLGKMVLRIKVTDLNGNKIGFGKATGRYLGKIISSFILCIGFIMVAFTQKKQGLHDIMAGCLVVNNDPETATSDDNAIEKMLHEEEIKKTRIIATVVLVVLYIAAFIAAHTQGHLPERILLLNIGYMIGLTFVPLIAYIVYLIYPKHNVAKYVYYILAILFILIYVFGGILYESKQSDSRQPVAPWAGSQTVAPAPESGSVSHTPDILIGKALTDEDASTFLNQFGDRTEDNDYILDRIYYSYKQSGIELICKPPDKRIDTVFLHSGNGYLGQYVRYVGKLPKNLLFSDSRAEVRRKLGIPSKSGGGEPDDTFGKIPLWDKYYFLPTYSLHVQYSENGTINSIAISEID